jgi:hypothetical protein
MPIKPPEASINDAGSGTLAGSAFGVSRNASHWPLSGPAV